MTTLALLKAEIAEDLDRNDMTSIIAAEIPKAIRHYQRTRFYFNETRDCVIATTADQKLYAGEDTGTVYQIVLDEEGNVVLDDAGAYVIFPTDAIVTDTLQNFITVDQVLIETDATCPLDQISPKEWELLTGTSANTGRPSAWCMYNRSYGLYPIPSGVFAIRFIGHVIKPGPATDDEEGNVWMTEAFDLIRARVCGQIALRKTRDIEQLRLQKQSEMDELMRLVEETTSRVTSGFVTPTEF